MTFSSFAMGVASATMTMVLFLYLRQVVRGSSTPNPVTWGVGCAIAWVNALTYGTLVEGEILKSLMGYIPAVGLLGIVGYALVKGKFTKVGGWEVATLLMTVALLAAWHVIGNSATNICSHAINLVSFVPTVMGLLNGKAIEKPLPWILALATYTLMTIVVFLDGGDGMWLALAYPATRVMTNAAVLISARIGKTENLVAIAAH